MAAMQRSTSRNKLLTRCRARSTLPPSPLITALNSALLRRVSRSRTFSSRRRFSPCSLSRSLASARHSAAIRLWSAISLSTSSRSLFMISFSAIWCNVAIVHELFYCPKIILFGTKTKYLVKNFSTLLLCKLGVEVVVLAVGNYHIVEATTHEALAEALDNKLLVYLW